MARQPYFSGNYGSALAQIDTRPIMQGAAAQAAMYQGLGQNIGGAIEKYQLNKEKREKNEAAAIGTISGMAPQMLQALSANPETAKLMERIQGENASPKDFDKFNAMSAAYTVQQKSNLEQAFQKTQNDMQGLKFGIEKELKETNIQVAKDRAKLIRLNRLLEEEADPQNREVLRRQREELIAEFGMGASRRAQETQQQDLTTEQTAADKSLIPLRTAAVSAQLGDVPGQVEDATATRKRNKKIAKALFDASGGAAGMAKTSMEDRDLKRNQVETYILSGLSNIKVNELNALAKFASPTVNQQATVLAADQGRLLGLTLTDPITKGQITFKKYLELNNTEGDDQYPLTGDAAGTAGTYNGRYVTGQRQLQELYDGVQVQANKTGTGGGTVGGTSASGLPPAVTPNMTPVQARDAASKRTTVLRNRILDLEDELTALGTNPESQYEDPYLASIDPSGPHSVGHITSRKQEIPAEIAALKAELAQSATNY